MSARFSEIHDSRQPASDDETRPRTPGEIDRSLDTLFDMHETLYQRVEELEIQKHHHVGIQEALERRILALEQGRGIAPQVREVLARVLPVVAGLFGSEPFRVAQLFKHSDIGLRMALDGLSPTKLGQIFASAASAGVEIDGLVIQRLVPEGHARLWSILRRR